mmetsp:Transcript_969/g.1190  ORF Transcript_969/g.1190 Transcript_969/m.1190 type:complete len:295 (+) Transcript_969:247-1131(+)|eukprot:CAMPEP_0184017534 /NCGR_PEP_ID=MMETSP0954-20121128/7594_1 /TAXON_ID=627963 /ORGANISM="Aplanochytrium sp, Strain PBS07" /LENGTH=294 /DNA_ID=CAMNT_0026298789 /DNA_START=204 /DNA_END=1088 /DNA_ORIENTATION=-
MSETKSVLSSEDVRSKVEAAVSKSKEAVAEVQTKIQEYDEKYQATASVKAAGEKASEYLKKAVEDAKTGLDDLAAKTREMKDTTTEIPVKALSKTIASIQQALDRIKDLASSYDDKYQISVKLHDTVNPAREQCVKYLAEASEHASALASAANAQLQGVNDGLRSKIREVSKDGYNFLIDTSASLDRKYDITSVITNTIKQIDEKYKLAAKAKQIDDKFGIHEKTEEIIEKALETGRGLDQRFTNGKYVPLVETAYKDGVKMVTEQFETIKTDFEESKLGKSDDSAEVASPAAE